MARVVFPSGRKLLLLVLAVLFVGGAWWWQGPPLEPVVEGVGLSAYLDINFQREGDARSVGEPLKSYGPAGVAWLAYKLEHGRRPFVQNDPLPLDNAPEWLRRWAPRRWGGLREESEIDERFGAGYCLESFGAEAAPAIPALARTMESGDPELAGVAADVFRSMGPAAWPAMREILDHGSAPARIVLFDQLYDHFGPGGKWAEPVVEAQLPSAVEIFIKAFRDPDPKVREKAAYSLGDCVELREDDDPCYNGALPGLCELLADRNEEVSAMAARTVGLFRARGAMAIPRLVEMVGDTDPKVRSKAAWALMLIDTPEHSRPRLRAMLEDPDPDCQRTAKEGLEFLDYEAAKKGAEGEASTGQ